MRSALSCQLPNDHPERVHLPEKRFRRCSRRWNQKNRLGETAVLKKVGTQGKCSTGALLRTSAGIP